MKKIITKNKLINSAIDIFSSLPYEKVAFSQITAKANVSNSLIYTYFKTKEELFKFLLEENGNRLKKSFLFIKGNSPKEKLKNFIIINLESSLKEIKLIKIYRLGQFKFPEYEQNLRNIYIETLEKIFERNITEAEYIYIIAGIRYIKTMYANLDLSINIDFDVDFIVDLIIKGLFPDNSKKLKIIKNDILYQISPFDINNKKFQILNTSTCLFGEKGFYNTKISDITTSLGIAVGSFYKYYENKEVLLKNITENINAEIFFFLNYNTPNSLSNVEKQLNYLYLISVFFQSTPFKYKIIREAEFVSKEISKKYFKQLEFIFNQSLTETNYTPIQKELLTNFLVGISHYLGIEFFFTKNISNIDDFLKELSNFFLSGISLSK